MESMPQEYACNGGNLLGIAIMRADGLITYR